MQRAATGKLAAAIAELTCGDARSHVGRRVEPGEPQSKRSRRGSSAAPRVVGAPAIAAPPIPLWSDPSWRGYFHTLLRNLNWPGAGRPSAVGTLGVTSCREGEGVSTVSASVALAAAGMNRRVVLVDAHLRRPTIRQTFGLAEGAGFSDAVSRPSQALAAIRPSGAPNLWVVTAGQLAAPSTDRPRNAARRPADNSNLQADAMYEAAGRASRLLRLLRNQFDLIVFDLPPVLESGAALPLLRHLDGVLWVMEHERVRREVAQRVRDDLDRAGAKILGVVMNRRRFHIPSWLYKTL